MAGYKPLHISGNQTGLVQDREEFILPNDAYPVLENAYVWRERIIRKQGFRLLGRLRRVLTAQNLGNTDGAGFFTGNIRTIIGIAASEPNSEIEPGSVSINVGGQIFTDPLGDGVLVGGGGGTINYVTMVVTLQTAPVLAATPVIAAFNYFPALPVMGLRTREIVNINFEETIAFDTKYAYRFVAPGWQEFITGFTWTGTDSDFFWTTNYWQSPAPANLRLFWETNFVTADGIRYTNGTTWVTFAPFLDLANTITLRSCLCLLPFRGRLVAFNTVEQNAVGVANYPQRIRWAAIGNPISTISAIFPLATDINVQAWYDDVRGQGGFLDIPTSDQIISVGFVRDNLVIYCERSTWQLRYTGRSISPFQVEKVNSELGTESTFSTVQFDTSLVGIGDKGIVECDSFKSQLIDIKIPDLVFNFNNDTEGPQRIQSARDFERRLAYWTYPYKPQNGVTTRYPNRRLVYNYENDSWAIFTDSLTALGTFQPLTGSTWANTPYPWQTLNNQWISFQSGLPFIVGGNQQGFVEYLDIETTNDISLSITAITGNTTTPTLVTSPNHNFQKYTIIRISNIPTGTPFDSLNGQILQAERINDNQFRLWVYNPATDAFDIPRLDPPGVYVGGGKIQVRDNFRITSKKFNFADEGNAIQLGYVDVLCSRTDQGSVSLFIYIDYDDYSTVNTSPFSFNPDTLLPNPFFNSAFPTSQPSFSLGYPGADKYWQRVFCPVRANFIVLEYTLNNSQMISEPQESNVQIDAQVLWVRKAGRMTSV